LLSANAIIDLPFGKGKRFLNRGGLANAIVGGWEINPLVSARSGLPYSVTCDSCSGANRPTLVGDPFANLAPGRLLNPAAFSTSASLLRSVTNHAGNVIRFGNLGRNTFRGPAIYTTDLSVLKNTQLTERFKSQLGFQFLNVFNHANYTVPNNNVNDTGGFGLIKRNAYPGRVIQYSVKFLF
jgi:hypothetical protein